MVQDQDSETISARDFHRRPLFDLLLSRFAERAVEGIEPGQVHRLPADFAGQSQSQEVIFFGDVVEDLPLVVVEAEASVAAFVTGDQIAKVVLFNQSLQVAVVVQSRAIFGFEFGDVGNDDVPRGALPVMSRERACEDALVGSFEADFR